MPALDAGEVHVWTLAVETLAARFGPEPAVLAEEERLCAARFRFEADRARYVVGRAAARHLIAAYGGARDPAALRFRAGAHGKPDLDPPRPDLRFNWSHSGDLAIFAVTADADVGVDVERTQRFNDLEAIAERVFSARELAEFRGQTGEARRIAFFNGWTRKEAFIKATGEGLSRSLAGFDVVLEPGAAVALRSIGGSSDEAATWSMLAFEPQPGYAAAVAVAAPAISLRLLDWAD